MNLVISVAMYGIVLKSLDISCDIYKDMSEKISTLIVQISTISISKDTYCLAWTKKRGNTFSFHHTLSNKEMF